MSNMPDKTPHQRYDYDAADNRFYLNCDCTATEDHQGVYLPGILDKTPQDEWNSRYQSCVHSCGHDDCRNCTEGCWPAATSSQPPQEPRIIHGENLVCPHCGAGYATGPGLTKHIAKSHPTQPPDKHQRDEITKILERMSYGFTSPEGKIGWDQARDMIEVVIARTNRESRIDELKELRMLHGETCPIAHDPRITSCHYVSLMNNRIAALNNL